MRALLGGAGALLLAAATPAGVEAQAELSRVDEIKAAVTFNVLKFVEWPSDDAPARRMCVASDATLRGALQELEGREAGGKPVEVRVLDDVSDTPGCHALVLSGRTLDRLDLGLDAVSRPALLTVGEGERFVEEGGMVALRVWRNRVRLQINLEAVEEGELRMSSQLLSLADLVNTGAGGG